MSRVGSSRRWGYIGNLWGQLQLFSHQKRSLEEPPGGVWALLQKPWGSKKGGLVVLCGPKCRPTIDTERNRGRLWFLI